MREGHEPVDRERGRPEDAHEFEDEGPGPLEDEVLENVDPEPGRDEEPDAIEDLDPEPDPLEEAGPDKLEDSDHEFARWYHQAEDWDDELEDFDPGEFEDDAPDAPAVWVVREGRHVGVALRSGRRRLGWNQRELARRAGLSQATIARMEAGADARLSVVVRALWACGLELVAAPPAGAPADWRVAPHPMDEGRDSGGRRLPAHLPAYPTGYLPAYTMWKQMVRGESLMAERPPHWLYAFEPWPVPPEPPDSKADR